MKLFHDHIKTIEYTNENLNNKIWRLSNLYPIRDKQGNLVPFNMNIHQIRIAERLAFNIKNNDYRPIVILKARQVGISTLFCLWFLDDVLFSEGRRAVIQSQKIETMHDIFAICRTAYQFMPVSLGHEYKISDINDKQGKISIPATGSFLESKLEVRSMAVNMMHFSEYAFMDLKRATATVGSLTPDCIKVYESTPCGLNHFYEFYREQKEQNPDNVFFIPWYKHYEYRLPVSKQGLGELTPSEERLKAEHGLKDEQIEFKRKKEQEMRFLDTEHQTFQQEYPENDEECFLLSGSGLIDPMILRELKRRCDATRPLKQFWDGKLLIKLFRQIDPKQTEKLPFYGMYVGVDPAEGVGRDYSAVIVIGVDDQANTEVLMTMRGFENPTLLAPKLEKYISEYFTFKRGNDEDWIPLVTVERNNHGHAMLALLEPTYPNLYIHYKDRRLGFLTTRITKRMILGNMFNVINSRNIKLNDHIIASELRTLIKNDAGQIEAEEGKKDDMVMGLALAYQGYFADYRNYGHDPFVADEEEEAPGIDSVTN